MTTISTQAAQARETARSSDGKFGHQPHDRATGIDLAAPAHDESPDYRAYQALAGAGGDPEAGGFEEYTRNAARTRSAVADDAASTLYQSALELLGEHESYDHDTWGSEEPYASDQLGDIEAGESAFLREHWDVVQEAASAEGVPVEKVAADITHYRLWHADVTSDHSSEAFQQLIATSDREYLIADHAPAIDDNGQVIWE